MENYVPDIYQKNIYDINYDKLKELGIKCILFDLDNTLVPRYSKLVDEKLVDLIEQLTNKFKVIIYSNSKKPRVTIFTDLLNIDGVYSARKPNLRNFMELLKKYRFDQNEVCLVGDQLFTDVFGGNRAGITTALVDVMTKKEGPGTKINRLREKRMVHKLNKRDLFFRGRYYDK